MEEPVKPNVPHVKLLPHRGVRLIWVGLILLTLLIIVVVAAGQPTVTPTRATNGSSISDVPSDATVLIMSNGFSPYTVTIKSGGTVTWENRDAVFHQPASDPHPTHTNLPGFDTRKGLKTGGRYRFTFKQPGTYTYHDHLFPSKVGKVVVE